MLVIMLSVFDCPDFFLELKTLQGISYKVIIVAENGVKTACLCNPQISFLFLFKNLDTLEIVYIFLCIQSLEQLMNSTQVNCNQ